MQDDRRAATEAFVEQLRASGIDVALEIVERDTTKYGLTFVEWTWVFLGAPLWAGFAGKMGSDLYDGLKQFLRERRAAREKERGSPGRPMGFVIYGPDSEVLRQWDTREDDEDKDGDAEG
jgi:ABC-type transport system substrate-binding protein